MAKIAIDCDGVLANFLDAFAAQADHLFPGRIKPIHGYWKTHTQWNWPSTLLSHDEVKQVWKRIQATPNWWMTIDAIPESVGALAIWFWQHHGHDVWICTARQPTVGHSVAFQTDTWLRACGVSPCSNYLGVIPAEGDDKADVYAAAGIEYSLDDKTETVEACDLVSGHTAFLLERPWNTNAKVKHRVKSVQEYLDYITKMSSK